MALPGYIYMDRIRSKEEYDELVTEAHKDNHSAFAPTHVLRKDGDIVGYFSINPPGVPLVCCWFKTNLSPRESFSAINMAESHIAVNGGVAACWPVPENSPFHSNMESMGYRSVGKYELFIKEL